MKVLASWILMGLVAGLLQALPQPATPRFYPDDPLVAEPPPIPVSGAERRTLSDVLETVNSTFSKPGQRQPANGDIAAQDVNTLGEVMNGDWYVNRHGAHPMSLAELKRGSGDAAPPDASRPWQVLLIKRYGINAGFIIADAKNDLYLLYFDPPGQLGLATGAQMVASRFLHALGYYVPENYLVQFDRDRLVATSEGQAVSSAGRLRPLIADDIDAFLEEAPRGRDGTYRAVATRSPGSLETLLGPYQVWGTRSDDPNDIVPHEHRRDLRGMLVFAAWLDIADFSAVSTQDILLTVDGIPRVRHYILDLRRSLGSGVNDGPKYAWEGNELLLPDLGTIGRNIASLGIVTPDWMREKQPNVPEAGRFGSQAFDPEAWTTRAPVAAFANRLPDDTFWAARQVLGFSDEEIRAVVKTGQYTPPAEDWITATLIERRNKIGRAFFSRVLPLDHFRIEDGTLAFDDLGARAGLSPPRTYTTTWYGFDNDRNESTTKLGDGPSLPAQARAIRVGTYVAAAVHAGSVAMNVTVFLRRQADGFQIVGIDRGWPGKKLVNPPVAPRANRQAYEDLAPRQRQFFSTYVESYNAARSSSRYTTEEVFERLTVSEQTTFYGVTHALLHSRLTDSQGHAMGLAIDRVATVERIAGQYPGKGGDEQFRLYVTLEPGTRDVLDKSREFFRDHENTVYHIGYPHSYRQTGKEPTLQFSMSNDGLRADIDVDYRSSRSPQALFNGHLTSSNSDVRAGDNPTYHNGRWQGLVVWWQNTFGKLSMTAPRPNVFGLDRPETPPTPLPPDHPADYAPDRVQDAAVEFLADWLVRRQVDQALAMVSPQAFACVNLQGDTRGEALDAEAARRELLRLMQYSSEKLGPHSDLTSVIEAFRPRDPNRQIIDHPFRREFLLTPSTPDEARQYLCDPSAAQPVNAEYSGVVFTFRAEGGGTLALLWSREHGRWMVISYQLLSL
jgi:hypothetical protein